MNITDRDRKMLTILFAVVLLGIVYVAVYTPLMNKYDSTVKEFGLKKSEYDLARLHIDSIDSLREKNETTKKDAIAKAENFFTPFQEDIVTIINEKIDASGLGFTGASFGQNGAKAIMVKVQSNKEIKYPLGDITASINTIINRMKGESISAAKPPEPANIESCESFKISINFKDTSYDRLLSFIRECENMNKVFKINSLAYTSQQQTNGGSIDMDMFTAPLLNGG